MAPSFLSSGDGSEGELALVHAGEERVPLALVEVQRVLAGVAGAPHGGDAVLVGNGHAVDDATRLGCARHGEVLVGEQMGVLAVFHTQTPSPGCWKVHSFMDKCMPN